MKITASTIDQLGKSRSIDPANCVDQLGVTNEVVWLDIMDFEPDEPVDFLKEFGLSPMALN